MNNLREVVDYNEKLNYVMAQREQTTKLFSVIASLATVIFAAGMTGFILGLVVGRKKYSRIEKENELEPGE